MSTKKITTMGILCAMAIIINLFIHFPIIPAVSFLHYDPKDIIIVISGFIYGPLTAFLMSLICSILEIFYRGGTVLDILMNVISTCAFACSAAYIYHHNRTKKGAIIGLSVGIIMTTICMLIWNYIITPIYFSMPRSEIVPLLLPGILPFNLIKSGLNAGITLFLYKPLVTILRHSNLIEKSDTTNSYHKGLLLFGLFISISLILMILVIQDII